MAKKSNNEILFLIIGALVVLVIIKYPSILQGNNNDFNYDNNINQDFEMQEKSCSEYSIYNQYVSDFGLRNVNALNSLCEKIYAPGTTTESDEYSCYIDGAEYSFVCPGTDTWDSLPSSSNWKIFVSAFEKKCDSMNAKFICRTDYFGCICNKIPPSYDYSQEEDNNEEQNQEEVIQCEDVVLPEYGDLGGICRENGYCAGSNEVCDSYWDYLNQVHKCGCTDKAYCGQYCYEYLWDKCVCPPNSHEEVVTKSTIECVPDNCECSGSEVIC
ncbi:MAG: hypothetical protein J7K29_03105 [Candidatus Cloacimonetes bacterium]|nr:hypothetical protein [Candidatus Cloacimonadota bacterium]